MENRICVSFRMILSEKDLDLLLQDINWKPEKIWRSGQPKIQGQCKFCHQDSGLSIDVEKELCFDLEEILVQLMEKVNKHAMSIKQILTRYKADVHVACAVYTDKQSFPSLLINNEVLKFLVDFHASIDIDIY